jgi:outer membrane immunogenic protein
MKKLLIGSATFIAFAAFGLARAADMPPPAYKAPPPPAPVYNWTGCYVDGGVGYGMWNQDHYAETYPAAPTYTQLELSSTSGGRGWLGRVGGGCDYQFNAFNSNFVIGVFGDYDFMGLSGNFADPYYYLVGNENESGAWYVGGRIGYLVTPTFLTYFDGGYTQTRFDQINLSGAGAAGGSTCPCGPSGLNFPATNYSGWFLGGGTEYALTWLPISGLFWRSEYRYSSYSAQDIPLVTSTGAVAGGCDVAPLPTCGEHTQKYVQTITTSLVWRFNFGGGY